MIFGPGASRGGETESADALLERSIGLWARVASLDDAVERARAVLRSEQEARDAKRSEAGAARDRFKAAAAGDPALLRRYDEEFRRVIGGRWRLRS